MSSHKSVSLIAIVLVFSFCASAFAFKKQKDQEKTATISITVLKGYNGRPLKNAAVVLHSVGAKGNQAAGGLELKTDNDGHASIDSIPYGRLRVQVIMEGYQTYGEDFDIAEPEKKILVKMAQPRGQFSIYTDATPTPAPSVSPSPVK